MMAASVRYQALVCVLWLCALGTPADGKSRNLSDAYHRKRSALIDAEMKITVGGTLQLSPEEFIVNNHLMRKKYEEIDVNFLNETNFNPAQNFIDRKTNIENSEVFKFIRNMPKGAVLHVHDTGMIGYEYVIKNITYRTGLYVCNVGDEIEFKFSKSVPRGGKCDWKLLSNLRELSQDVEEFDKGLAKYLSLEFMNPEKRTNGYVLWEYFMKIFEIITPLLTYKPVFEDYFYEALRQYSSDRVMYVELRTTLPALYDLDGTVFDPIETAKSYKKVSEKFKRDYPDSLGSRIIYAPPRFVDPEGVQEYLRTLKKLKANVGDYLAGFDLVGEEDTGKPLLEYIDQLIELAGDTNTFYHAGETNWYGTTTDFNLYDAVLLGTKRIGHGFALNKHPIISGIVKEKGIAVEVNPISNQVLKLVDDIRNHPASIMVSQNIPIVVSSDDPGLWGALPLSHDVYEMFMGVASRHADIRFLKQLALNSLFYSSMQSDEKERAIEMFKKDWDTFIRSSIIN